MMTTSMKLRSLICICVLLLIGASACRKSQPPVARPTPPTPPPTAGTTPPAPPEPMREPMPPEPLPSDDVAGRSLDDLNRDSPLRPVFFELDSSDVSDASRTTLQANAAVLKKYPSWVITIEGHCDERGTPEYNLALGERRAVSARQYLISLGVDASRLRTVSYGSEFPFDPAHQESAWSRNRRAHFVITAK
ncbi:MAG: peptidoglycan-associated lipoprotein Pal [Acidobacteria bacterium]|nr:MAG: peptidoglycan-associated lipoprotein Pal [Acidobacteriota bacterium]